MMAERYKVIPVHVFEEFQCYLTEKQSKDIINSNAAIENKVQLSPVGNRICNLRYWVSFEDFMKQ